MIQLVPQSAPIFSVLQPKHVQLFGVVCIFADFQNFLTKLGAGSDLRISQVVSTSALSVFPASVSWTKVDTKDRRFVTSEHPVNFKISCNTSFAAQCVDALWHCYLNFFSAQTRLMRKGITATVNRLRHRTAHYQTRNQSNPLFHFFFYGYAR